MVKVYGNSSGRCIAPVGQYVPGLHKTEVLYGGEAAVQHRKTVNSSTVGEVQHSSAAYVVPVAFWALFVLKFFGSICCCCCPGCARRSTCGGVRACLQTGLGVRFTMKLCVDWCNCYKSSKGKTQVLVFDNVA